jgi:hypothetical protein
VDESALGTKPIFARIRHFCLPVPVFAANSAFSLQSYFARQNLPLLDARAMAMEK